MPRTVKRTQAERREATIDALLDATIESLAEVGFAATTTRGVAERAGVSQGAQQHYFPSKGALVDAAINRFMAGLADAARSRPLAEGSETERAGILLDRLWELHQTPLFAILPELLTLARTHTETAELTAATAPVLADLAYDLAAASLPAHAANPGFRDWILTALAALRGAAMATAAPAAAATAPSWTSLRAILLAGLPEPAQPTP